MADSGGSEASGGEGEVAGPPAKRAKRRTSDARGVSAGTGSVCKLFVKKAPCNYADPWRKHSQFASTGTGFLLGGKWVVTNAHVVHRAVSVLVRATTGPPVKYNAKVVAVGFSCDLAVLEMEAEFWKGKESLELSREIPRLDDNVTCIGFPMGGENISVTRGVVSRIDVNSDGLLRVQIDAAINPGNSGGPVLGAHGKVVGVAASHLKNASNIGYIIPTQVLEQFLSCLGDASTDQGNGSGYLGIASLGIGRVQTLESPALRQKLGLPVGCTAGVRVPTVWGLGAARDKLQMQDVLLEIDGVEISQDATVPLRDNERIHFLHHVTRHVAGRDSVRLKVWRDGAALEVCIAVMPDRWIVPRIDGYDAAPEYAIVGGLVFVPLSYPWAEQKRSGKHGCSAAAHLMHQYCDEPLLNEGQQKVILSKVLAHPCNVGYHALGNMVLASFAGSQVKNLAELAKLVAACTSEHFVFEFQRPTSDGKELVVLNRAECRAAQQEIHAQHLIASPCMVRPDARGEPRPLEEGGAEVGVASAGSAQAA